jgi:hypothetical protein
MKSVKWVEFDLNEMIKTHKKLSKGEVEPPIINSAEIDMKSLKFSNQVGKSDKTIGEGETNVMMFRKTSCIICVKRHSL